MSIAEVMRPHPITVRPHHTVLTAAAVLLDHGIDAVPVVTAEGEMRGILDEASLVTWLARERPGFRSLDPALGEWRARLGRQHRDEAEGHRAARPPQSARLSRMAAAHTR